MAINYTWSVLSAEVTPEREGKQNVVSVVHWEVSGEDAGVSASLRGAHALTFKADEAFAPYESLTESQIIAWVKDTMGDEMVASAEADVAQQISNKANAPKAATLPWA